MFKLSDPLATIVVTAAALTVGFLYGDYSADKRNEAEQKRINREAVQKYNALVAETNWQQRIANAQIEGLQANAERVELNAKITIDKLRADVRSRAIRVSVPVASCSANPSTGDSTATPDDGQTRAELLPETVLDLVNIAADANSEVRRTNLCIDQYNEVKAMLDRLRNNKVE